MSALSLAAETEIRAARSAIFAAVSLHPKTAASIFLAVGLLVGFFVGRI